VFEREEEERNLDLDLSRPFSSFFLSLFPLFFFFVALLECCEGGAKSASLSLFVSISNTEKMFLVRK